MRRILELGEKKPWEKEAPNMWVFRVLNLLHCIDSVSGVKELRLEHGRFYVGDPGTTIEQCDDKGTWDRSRYLALTSWLQFESVPNAHTRSVSIVIGNKSRTAFLLQRKDRKHPLKSCQGRYSLFGGSPHLGEGSEMASWRKLIEEIHDTQIYYAKLREIDTLTLDSIQQPGTHRCSVSLIELEDTDFLETAARVAFRGLISESIAVVITREEFEQLLLPEEIEEPGRYFIASHHLALNRVLQS